MNYAQYIRSTSTVGLAAILGTGCPSVAYGKDGKDTPATPVSGNKGRDETACPTREEILYGKDVEARSATAIVGVYPCWDADESNGRFRYLSDLYAHWTIREIRGKKAAYRNYKGEHRPALLRLFVGKNLSLISSVRIDLQDPEMTFIIPLASFAYEGRVGKGESWSTNLVGDDQTQPFFRIGPTTSAKINVSAKASSDLEVKASGTILNALRNLTAVVSPGSGLITTLNRESLQQTSNALDSALSSIWSESHDEQQISGRQLSEWYEPAGYIVQLTLPGFVKTMGAENTAQGNTRWYYLTLSCPRYSIFDPKQACGDGKSTDPNNTADESRAGIGSDNFLVQGANLKKRISAQQVNNFRLASGKTLHQFLAGQDWYSSFLRKSGKAPGNALQTIDPNANTAEATDAAPEKPAVAGNPRTDNDYAALCNSIVDTLYSTGLSSFDAQVGLWATVSGSPDFVGVDQEVQSNSGCRRLLPPGFGEFVKIGTATT